MLAGLLGILILTSCVEEYRDTGAYVPMSDQWIQLNEYFTNSCFYLSSELGTVIEYKAGNKNVEYTGWEWGYAPPDSYKIERYKFSSTSLGKGCWEVNAYGLTDIACPCYLRIPYSWEP